jgi:hypothetical protein
MINMEMVGQSPEIIKAYILTSLEKLQNDFANLHPDQEKIFIGKFRHFCRDVEDLEPIVEDYNDSLRIERITKKKDMIQKHIDNGLKFNKIVLDGIEFVFKDGKLGEGKPNYDDMPWNVKAPRS